MNAQPGSGVNYSNAHGLSRARFVSDHDLEVCEEPQSRENSPPIRRCQESSTIYGDATRGTGILNNELSVGRLVWNRLRYLKNPDTGKRAASERGG